jgi:hypothetical protein
MIVAFPSEPFELICDAVGKHAPPFAQSEFRIRVDIKRGIYEFSHFGGERTILKITSDRLILRDEWIAKGRDNSGESWHLSYDLSSGQLDYREIWKGRMGTSHQFTTKCRIG